MGFAGLVLLLLHFRVETGFVYFQSAFQNDFPRKIQGKSVRVVQAENLVSSYNCSACILHFLDESFENSGSLVHGKMELFLLQGDDLENIIAFFTEVRISASEAVDDSLGNFRKEQALHAHETSMAGSPAQQTTKNIPTTFV